MAKEIDIPLADEAGWEDSLDNQEEEESSASEPNLSELGIMYLAQIQDLQQQLEQEHLKVQRLEMAIKGFSIALQEEIEKGP
tara:strand:+ start:393 stop:638 length:246 start_codon:yes stop_codon:yes gene_type:complete